MIFLLELNTSLGSEILMCSLYTTMHFSTGQRWCQWRRVTVANTEDTQQLSTGSSHLSLVKHTRLQTNHKGGFEVPDALFHP